MAKITSAELKKIVKDGNVILGTEKAVKSLRLGKVEKIMMSSNCPAGIENDITYYAGLTGTEVHKLDFPNDELGIICKKPFSISVLAIVKQQNSTSSR